MSLWAKENRSEDNSYVTGVLVRTKFQKFVSANTTTATTNISKPKQNFSRKTSLTKAQISAAIDYNQKKGYKWSKAWIDELYEIAGVFSSIDYAASLTAQTDDDALIRLIVAVQKKLGVSADGKIGDGTKKAYDEWKKKQIVKDLTAKYKKSQNISEYGRGLAQVILEFPDQVESAFDKVDWGWRDNLALSICSNLNNQELSNLNKNLRDKFHENLDDGWTSSEESTQMSRLKKNNNPVDVRIGSSKIKWAEKSKAFRMQYVGNILMNGYSFSKKGSAAIVGNIWSESQLIPNRVEGNRNINSPMEAKDFSGKLKTFTAEEIQDRKYKKSGPKLPGIGLAQWTYHTRRAAFFEHEYKGEKMGKDMVFSMDAQIDFLVSEIKRDSKLLSALKSSSKSLESLSDMVLVLSLIHI